MSCRLLVYILLLALLPLQALGQNLVPNPGFEDTLGCPQVQSAINQTRHWYSIYGTTDYFHSCIQEPWHYPPGFVAGVPVNSWGYQYAASGEAYAGGVAHSQSSPGYSLREYLSITLSEPLKAGYAYAVSFKTNLANCPQPGVNVPYACNNIGLLFHLGKEMKAIPNRAHIYNPEIISDTLNWTTISGTFIADSSYTHIALGNFFDDRHSDTMHIIPYYDPYVAYYYYDDVQVEEVPKITARDTLLCLGDSMKLHALYSGDYYWSLHADGRDTLSTDSIITIAPVITSTYYLIADNRNRQDAFTVHVFPPPSVYLGKDTSICLGDELILDAFVPHATYQWSTGSRFHKISLNKQGEYSVTVSLGRCIATDTIQVSLKEESACIEYFRLYPNPFFYNLFIEGNFPDATPLSIHVCDALGRDIGGMEETQVQGQFTYRLQLYWLEPAVYFVRVKKGDKVLVYKVVKM